MMRWDGYEAAVLADRRLEALLAGGMRSWAWVCAGPLLALGVMGISPGGEEAWEAMSAVVYGTGAWVACGEVRSEWGRWVREGALGVGATSQVMGALRATGLLGVLFTAGFVAVAVMMGASSPPVGWLALVLLALFFSGLGSGVLVATAMRARPMAWAVVAGVVGAQLAALGWAGANWWVPVSSAYASLEAFGGEAVDVFAGAGRLAAVAATGGVGVMMSMWMLARRRY
ncbi:hypothetical protein EA187_07200 [Lujinxingia sediminis]|uniref:ABC transporter permease n=1 Tax=Lujinxingia sediminis TaxID=2480984 RepID=A0ABY0CW84_9DELT|nr:hypothetical protein [Lujinxingia sediminis]RVU46914.1 hypothetical protein EA187_07200 [Lujinxingia sediminis]